MRQADRRTIRSRGFPVSINRVQLACAQYDTLGDSPGSRRANARVDLFGWAAGLPREQRLR